MTRLDVEQVKRGNPIAAVVERHGVELRRSGTRRRRAPVRWVTRAAGRLACASRKGWRKR